MEMCKRKRWEIGAVCVLFLLLAGYAEKTQSSLSDENELIRGQPGSGTNAVDLVLDAGEILKNYSYTLEIPAMRITQKEAKAYFEKAKQEIDESFYAQGDRAEHVTQDVHMKKSLAGGNVKAEWSLDHYEAVDVDGELLVDALKPEGIMVQATAELTCGVYKEAYTFSFLVYPPELSEEEQVLKAVQSVIDAESTEEGNQYLTLPKEAAGIPLKWKEKKKNLVWKVLFFEVVVLILLRMVQAERTRTIEKERRDQMQMDYSDVVNKLLILLGSGMSLKQAWNRISAQYLDKRQKKEMRKRYVYEEMVITNYEICDGESERTAYRKFGERTGLGPYQRLIRILLQNLQTGSRGLCSLLEQEAETAMEERKALARKLGEEAGTKMLMPLMLMLGIVIAIIMVPAMLSFHV